MLLDEKQIAIPYCAMKDPELQKFIQHLENQYHTNISTFFHEIRNPLTLVNSFLQLTQTLHPEVLAFDTWSPLMENMNYLRNLIEDLSDYNHSNKIQKEQISLDALLSSIVKSSSPLVKPIPLSFQKQGIIPPGYFDRIKIRRAILNLIRNAWEALKDQNDGEILISVIFQTDTYFIRVENNGPCIPPEYLPTLFDPFVSHKKDGTGLGLAIVNNIILAHQGHVEVSSSQSKTCFTLILPQLFDHES